MEALSNTLHVQVQLTVQVHCFLPFLLTLSAVGISMSQSQMRNLVQVKGERMYIALQITDYPVTAWNYCICE